uniref:Uncharacterized protein n=2 Tax=Oryza TaxID=4527 RepID=Q84RV2_ORYSJ|nr:hypothetical protein [Oryza sativa Japonica Group]
MPLLFMKSSQCQCTQRWLGSMAPEGSSTAADGEGAARRRALPPEECSTATDGEGAPAPASKTVLGGNSGCVRAVVGGGHARSP